MGRNLILCFDGTNNQFGNENTNVVRLVQVLDRDPSKQRLYYDPGVGTLAEPGFVTRIGKKISDICGLAFGAGLDWKIQQAYTYLMDILIKPPLLLTKRDAMIFDGPLRMPNKPSYELTSARIKSKPMVTIGILALGLPRVGDG